MTEKEYIIDIDESRHPYNAYLLLPLVLLEQLTPLLLEEIMLGLVDTDGDDKVVLHLFLDKMKIEALKQVVAVTEYQVVLVHKYERFF